MRRKFWQFSLRSLLLLVFLSALAAAWWSHRRYCLERAVFHARKAVQDQIDSSSAEAEAALADMKNQVAEYSRVQAEENEKGRQALEDSAPTKRELNFFDESIPERARIASARAAGYLIVPVEPTFLPVLPAQLTPKHDPIPAAKGSSQQTTASPSPSAEQLRWEQRAKALKGRSEYHTQQRDHFFHAIYRPWMRLKEPRPPEVPEGGK